MGEQLTPADAALLSRVLGHEIEPGLVRTLGPSTLAAIIQAARAEGPHPESGEWVMVPREPTEAMLVNGREALLPVCTRDRLATYGPVRAVWDDMIAASPPPKGEALPVAWQVRTRGKTTWSSWWHSDEKPDPTDFNGGYGVEIRPLYARPSPGVSREVALDLLASLVAATSLLEALPATQKGPVKAPMAASDRIFRQMLADYNASIERGRADLALLSRGDG